MLGPRMVDTGIVPHPPASSQAKKPLWALDLKSPNVETVGFYLATWEQVEDPQFVRNKRIGLMANVLGKHSREVIYPEGVDHAAFAVSWEGGRTKELQTALPKIVEALSQGLNVCVHCLQSFHRGPMGLCAVGRRLFSWDPRVTLKYIGTKRDIYGPYCN